MKKLFVEIKRRLTSAQDFAKNLVITHHGNAIVFTETRSCKGNFSFAGRRIN